MIIIFPALSLSPIVPSKQSSEPLHQPPSQTSSSPNSPRRRRRSAAGADAKKPEARRPRGGSDRLGSFLFGPSEAAAEPGDVAFEALDANGEVGGLAGGGVAVEQVAEGGGLGAGGGGVGEEHGFEDEAERKARVLNEVEEEVM